MTKGIFRYFCIVLICSIVVSSSILVLSFIHLIQENTKKELLYSVQLVEYFLQSSDDVEEDVKGISNASFLDNTRLTILDNQGNVLVDSDFKTEENHLERVEIKEALANGEGYSVRYSKTADTKLIYVAYYNGEYVIRVSMPYSNVMEASNTFWIPLSVSVVISLMIAFYIAKRLAGRLAKPVIEISKELQHMNQGKELYFNEYEYEEYNVVARALLSQEKVIQQTMDQLKFEKLRIANIIDQMNEGFVLLDNEFSIIMVNHKAKEIVHSGMRVGISIKEYIFNKELMQAIQQVHTKKRVDFKKSEFIYSCFITKTEYGVTLLFVDVTENRKTASMRQEFFSNISHELKTPMTAIRGYSELLENDMIVDNEIRKEVYNKIQKEIGNMTTLVNDILMISRLESKNVEIKKVKIHMLPLVMDIIESLDYQANEKNITVKDYVEDITYMADMQHLQQIFSNLISNAIKYNKENETVEVKVYKKLGSIYIEVKDRGIGISKLDQNRVFERFYRCDKARNKKISGTGLGLSIVKHIVQYYKGVILLDSELDVGTKITVILPISKEDM